ncbi:sulfotransferase family 2 domain-containing protein [Rubrivivax gelatinosus]|uniref:Sulfotransferase family protein n=1 Tax=Rubrivivax gelatinosus TaxID=28068 RepID=A0A4V2SFF9_RUBGE|nr:sulfotransferase family 2 domain-containing protein [Rubrivivax gelatinosus]MBK1690281.1 hypothetical protein [Rubrivivax gelatinosus]TCO97187.1 sulfotransferase family protein [Rubrivivax gelatinosus]
MLVSHRHQFIFVKTLKTGGTSVEGYFERWCMPEGAWVPSHTREMHISEAGIVGERAGSRPNPPEWWNHMPAEMIRDRVGPQTWESYFKFSVVRNPYDQMVSLFYFKNRELAGSTFDGSHPAAFMEWLRTVEAPNSASLCSVDGRLALDFLIRYERLHDDLQTVCARVGVPWDRQWLPEYKRGLRPPQAQVAAMYGPEARAIADRLLAEELDRLGYTFPG